MQKYLKMLAIFFLLLPLFCYSANIGNRDTGCPIGYENHPVILMSLDGFRADYLSRGLTPTIQKLIDEGVSAPYMRANFPTVTFPNHYTIATGLYPESHGIISNEFYDSKFNQTFAATKGSLTEGKWFSGEPIWNTVLRNGMKSGTYFWPGSEAEINGLRPSYYYPYSDDAPFKDRIDQVLTWLTLPIEDRPSWMCVYFHEPDSTGHDFGPISPEVDLQLERMDKIVLSLTNGIADLGLTDCVNLIIVSDHGMAAGSETKVVHLDRYDPILDEKAEIFFGATSRLKMKEGYEDEKVPVMDSLACQTQNMRQFDKRSLPKRYHFSNNPRIEDIILGLDSGYASNFEGTDKYRVGLHGYDNEYLEMQAIFLASGPAFKKAYVTRPFQSIELYNLMCDLLSIEPANNNGTKGSLYHIMNNPPNYPELPLGVYPKVAYIPNEDSINKHLVSSECSGDLSVPEDWIYSLDIGEREQNNLGSIHIPFGVPTPASTVSSEVTLLYHSDHITGFSQSLKMPVWTSFTFNMSPTGSQEALWSSDARLSPIDSPKCSDYESLTNFSMHPLFHPDFSQERGMDRIPFMVSNALPMSDELSMRYRQLMQDLIPLWQQVHGGPLNVIAGPVFDNDFNSLVDDLPNDRSGSARSLSILPSDMFVIVTKCLSKEIENLGSCDFDDLQISAFIYTQSQTVSNCLDRDSYAVEFSARVKDIELATGLIFFSDLGYQDATDLALRCRLGIWPTTPSVKLRNAATSPSIPFYHYLLYFITTLSFMFSYNKYV